MIMTRPERKITNVDECVNPHHRGALDVIEPDPARLG
jgi:hypothetical protein